MRILVLSNVPPTTLGGAEVQALHLSRRWAAAGHQVIVAGQANLPREETTLSVVRLPTLQQGLVLRAMTYLASTIWLLWRRRQRYDLIYCFFLKEHAFAASLAKFIFRLRQPLVACPGSTSIGGDAAYISRSPVKWIWIGVLRRGVTVINAMSRRIEQEVLDLGFGDIRMSRIPNGAMLPAVSPQKEAGNRTLRILFLGRLVKEKGLDTLLEAAHRVKSAGQKFELRIVGSGPMRQALEAQVRELALEDCVQLHAAVPPDQVSEQFTESDLFVLPSRREGMPGALLEAIAHGLPAVATRVSGSEEIIDEHIGWLVSVADPDELARAIGHALGLSQERLREMGKCAREKAVREYDMNRVAARYLQLFEELTD